jgi:hypothetical protein
VLRRVSRFAPRFAAILVIALPPVGATAAPAQTVLLEIRPRVGDTLIMRLDQTVEMIGTTRVGKADSTMRVRSTMRVLARSVVLKSDAHGSLILSITDSVSMSSEGGSAPNMLERASRTLEGQRVQLRLGRDGSAAIVGGDDGGSPELRAVVSQMPASFPPAPVSVGERWTRVMQLPVSGQQVPAGGELHATFRFDSLSRDGDIAYLSMRGQLTRDSSAAQLPDGMMFRMSGWVVGALQVDRRRGWLTDARTTMNVRSVLTPPPGGDAQPMRFQMKITQRMRAMDKR